MSPRQYPCGGTSRRAFLAGAAAVPALQGVRLVSAAEPKAAANPKLIADGSSAIPGPYPGRVVEVRNPKMIKEGAKDAGAIRATVARGMKELTGADDDVSAWRGFFEPGDVVGIKMNPVGNPLANTNAELMLAVIDGLKAAGVKPSDIFVFERYRGMFMDARMHEAVPDGVRWGGLTPADDNSQLEIAWPDFKNDPVAGYDRDEYVEMNLVDPQNDPKDDRSYRSHLGLLVTKRVNKLVMLPVLKDHGSAGITGALKNMSHGMVNNVARSHASADANACNQFIPEVVNHPIIRKKCVLQILDGIKGVFQKGPFGANPEFVWEYNALFFATDPVAMDQVEWRIIDAQRKEKGLPPVAATGKAALDPLGTEGFDVRQPQHVVLAGNIGLGVGSFVAGKGGGPVIEHRIVSLPTA